MRDWILDRVYSSASWLKFKTCRHWWEQFGIMRRSVAHPTVEMRLLCRRCGAIKTLVEPESAIRFEVRQGRGGP